MRPKRSGYAIGAISQMTTRHTYRIVHKIREMQQFVQISMAPAETKVVGTCMPEWNLLDLLGYVCEGLLFGPHPRTKHNSVSVLVNKLGQEVIDIMGGQCQGFDIHECSLAGRS